MSAAAAIKLPSWDERVDALSHAAADRAHEAAWDALERGVMPENILDLMSVAIDEFTRTHPDTAYGLPKDREEGRQQNLDDLYRALRNGRIPMTAFPGIACLVAHASRSDDFQSGWRADLYLILVLWLVASKRSLPGLLDIVYRVADYLVRWQADDDLDDGVDRRAPSPQAESAADTFIAALLKAGAA